MEKADGIKLLIETADFIVKYGFLAVGLALVGVVAPLIYKYSDAKKIALATLCFGLAFIVTYGVLGVVTAVAPGWIGVQRVMLIGYVRNVPNGKSIQIQSDLWKVGHAFTKREHDPGVPNVFNFPFILLSQNAPGCIDIGLVSADPKSDDSHLFKIGSISAADMGADSQIIAQIGGERDAPVLDVWREQKDRPLGQRVALRPLGPTEAGCARARTSGGWSLFGRAHAQGGAAELTSRLQSDDVFTRRDARIELSKKTGDDLKLLTELVARDDNYRLQLGAVVALAALPDDARSKMPSAAFEKVRLLRNSTDKTMRDSAVQALKEPAYCYQEIDTNKPAERRFLALCHWTREQCDRTRGPNNNAGVTQSGCAPVDLTRTKWRYAPGGTSGAWYQYDAAAFDAPFPKVGL